MNLSLFKNYTSTQPISTILEAVVCIIREDERIKSLTEAYRTTGEASVKESCPLFGVAAIFRGGKQQKHIERLTGLSLVDIDHIRGSGDGPDFRQKIIADPHTLLCYTTISGEGLRVIFRYELDESFALDQQIQYYPKAFAVGNAHYAKLLGVATDGKCKNVGRLSGLAYDPDVFVNPDALPFTKADIETAWQAVLEVQRSERRLQREKKRLQACYDKTIRAEVEADGAVYASGSHNDYVMRVGYKLNQFGFDQAIAEAWAAETFSDYAKASEVVASCYARTEEHGVRKSQGPLLSSPKGEGKGAWAGVEEIQQFLSEHVQLRHNVITGRVEGASPDSASPPTPLIPEQSSPTRSLSRGRGGSRQALSLELPSPIGEGLGERPEQWKPISDRMVNSLWAAMSVHQRVNIQDMYRVIESDYVPEYHPFEEYLFKVKNERVKSEKYEFPEGSGSAIHELASTVRVRGGEEEQVVWEEYLRKWLVAMVASWVDADVVNNVILVFIGEQGSYKTTWFNYLLPPCLRQYFYTKTNASRMGRDDLLTLAQYGLVCCEELDTMRPAELNQLKAAVTMPAIDERAAYAHFHEHRLHIASFCGTGNNTQFLSDPTGNRRWLPFEVEHIRSPREYPFNHDAIYAEAYSLYRSGFRFWFTKEEIIQLNRHNRRFETPRLESELVQIYFRHPTPTDSGEFMSVARALQTIGVGITQKLSPINLGRAFVEQGYVCTRYNGIRGYIVVCRTAQEIAGIMKTMAHESQPDELSG